jgi:hypothetical protein
MCVDLLIENNKKLQRLRDFDCTAAHEFLLPVTGMHPFDADALAQPIDGLFYECFCSKFLL